MSDPVSPSFLAFEAFRFLAYLNVAMAGAFLTVIVVALVCCVFELRGERREIRRLTPSWRLAIALVLVVCPVGLGAQAREDTSVVQPELPAASLQQDTARTVTRRVWAEAELYDVSPDGRLATFTDWTTGDVAVRDMETGDVRRLTSGRNGFAEDAIFSHDGKWLAYPWYDTEQPSHYKLGVVDIEGRNPRLIYQDPAVSWIAPGDWSPDGRHIVAAQTVEDRDAQELVLIRADGGDTRLLKSFPNPSPGKGPIGMCFSPDGRYVAYHYWRDDPENSDVYVLNVSTGEERVLIEDPADDRMLGWAPDGRYVLFQSDRSGTPGAWLLPVANGKPDGAPWLVKPDMWRTSGLGFTQDGRYFYKVTIERTDVYVANFDPQSRSVIGTPTVISARSVSNTSGALWSPDGRHLAYRRERDQASPVDRIVVQSMETGDVKEFNLGVSGFKGVHSWTADGRALVIWVSNPGDRDNRVAVYRLDVQTGRKELLPNPRPSIPLSSPVPAPDRAFLLYQLFEENAAGQAAFRIVRHELETGDSTVLFQTPFGAWGQILGAEISPDGQTIAFGYSPVVGSAPKSLILLPVTGEEPQELPIEGTRGITWMPDGQSLLFHRFVAVGPDWDAWYVNLAEGEPQPIGLTVHGTRPGAAIHPDGRRIAYTSGKGGAELWVMENFLPEGDTRR
jgi:Tol biopolymer transport system component